MKITKYLTLIAAVLFVFGQTTACNNTETKNVATNQPAANNTANTNKPEANKSETNTTDSNKSTVGSMATPTDTYKSAYAARQNKDIEGLKKVFSKELLEFLTNMAKAEKKSVDDNLKVLLETPQGKTNESRNEKIDGDHATLEYLNDSGAWLTMDFVKEGSDWKMTIPKADKKIDGDKKKETNTK